MNGAMMRATSRFAIAAAFGLVVGISSARAADLGGNCCADLEERVAELEATAARKGNRKMSLTITGQVNKVIQYWNDGFNSATRFGLDNTNSSSRFSFLGEGKVTPTVKIGFDITIETEGVNTTSRQNQFNEDGTFSNLTYISPSSVNQGTANSGNSDSFFGDARRAAVWVEDARLGRATLGRYESAGVVGTIDLGGISVIGGSSVALLNGNFAMRSTDGGYTAANMGSFLDPSSFQGRSELLRYDSPSIQGFIFSASIAEEVSDHQGPYWGTMLRYANEFNGVRVAAGIGYEHIADKWTAATLNSTVTVTPGGTTSAGGPANSFIPGTSGNSRNTPDIDAWGLSLAALHVPSGLFLQGQYMKVAYNNAGSTTTGSWGETCGASTSGGTSVVTTPITDTPGAFRLDGSCNPKKDADFWQVQGGITKNWFGFGNTALYAEYNRLKDWGAEVGGRSYANSQTSPSTNGFTSLYNVTSTDVRVYGLGVVQYIDAAATELYLGWRHFDFDINADAFCVAGTPFGVIGNTGKAAGTVTVGCGLESLDVVTGGARVKF
jgi:hypothetical protein